MGDAGADGGHGAGRLVADEERVAVADGAGDVVQIRLADPARGDVHDDLAGTGIGDDDIEQFDWCALGARDDSLDGGGHGVNST